jgi:hypothetical protein
MRSRLNTIIGETPATDPFRADREAVTEQGLAGARKQQQMLEEEIAARGEAFKGREERLAKREEKITKDSDQNAGLAFLEAGLAIMGGSSPFALQNLALGTKGVEAYTKGKDKIDAARERLDDARDRIEEYRRNENMMNAKERRQTQAGIDNLLTQGKKDLLTGAEQAYGRQTQLGTAVFGALNQAENTSRVIASHEKIAQLDANTRMAAATALPGEARLAMMLGTGDTMQDRYMSGARRMQEAMSDKTGMGVVKLLTETNAKREAGGMQPITMQELLNSAREFTSLMYPKVADVQNTRAR